MEQINNNSNKYLHITLGDSKIHVRAFDGVFGYSASLDDWENYERYCNEKANDWILSPLVNFDSCNKEDREKISKKWIEAKNLREGSYEYYFNLEDIKECFRNEVIELAKRMGITDKVDLKKEFYDFLDTLIGKDNGHLSEDELFRIAEYFYELGLTVK